VVAVAVAEVANLILRRLSTSENASTLIGSISSHMTVVSRGTMMIARRTPVVTTSIEATAVKKPIDGIALLFYYSVQHWKGGDRKVYEF
jgi:hypothetical protein